MQGNQSKLDKNENGKIDSQDFKMLKSKKEVGEMGKPSLKAKFEAAMQKKFDSDNKKKSPKDLEWEKKYAISNKQAKEGRSMMIRAIEGSMKPSIVKDVERYIQSPSPKKPKLLQSMSKKSM